MNTKENILKLGTSLLQHNGYNAFSYHNIATELDVKNAAIHYHFPNKEDLGKAIILQEMERFKLFVEDMTANRVNDYQQLDRFLQYYISGAVEGKVCIIGSLSNDYHSLSEAMQVALKELILFTQNWLTELLRNGHKSNYLNVEGKVELKAIELHCSLVAGLQISRSLGPTYIQHICTQTLRTMMP